MQEEIFKHTLPSSALSGSMLPVSTRLLLKSSFLFSQRSSRLVFYYPGILFIVGVGGIRV